MRYLIIFGFSILCLIINSQIIEHNDVIDDSSMYTPVGPTLNVFKSTGETKYLRVNFHFILKDDGTGNFSET